MYDKRLEQMVLWFSGANNIVPGLNKIKKFFIWKFSAACMECGWMGQNPYTGKWVIELDHIDGDHKNSAPSNFRLLCPNCHAMTQTYKSLNHSSKRSSYGVCRLPVETEW